MFDQMMFLPLAYIGPGAGMGLIMALVGLVAAVGAALFSVALWPLRNMLKNRKQSKQNSSGC
jgi:hypothetical protein